MIIGCEHGREPCWHEDGSHAGLSVIASEPGSQARVDLSTWAQVYDALCDTAGKTEPQFETEAVEIAFAHIGESIWERVVGDNRDQDIVIGFQAIHDGERPVLWPADQQENVVGGLPE